MGILHEIRAGASHLATAQRHTSRATLAARDAETVKAMIARACATDPARRRTPLGALQEELLRLKATAEHHRRLAQRAAARHAACLERAGAT